MTKMNSILDDASKFENLGSVEENDNTLTIEKRIQRRLLELLNGNIIQQAVYNDIRPLGSQTPRMYGLPKTHKTDIPFRPILSVVGSSQHELAIFLSVTLQPVLELYSSFCIQDSFSLAELIRQFDPTSDQSFLCSFDICSLFTNVPLDETFQICADTLYSGKFIPPDFPKAVFIEFMHMATSGVEFSFNNTMFRQTDGIAMGSSLGPVLANIFVGYNENKLFYFLVKSQFYKRYVDDTFAIFENEAECDEFFNILNPLNPSLKFTSEKEESESLAFSDVKIQQSDSKFITSVYRKPSFTSQYIRWDSFGPSKRKKNLISTLVHRALCICSKSLLQQELENISVNANSG